MAPSSPALQRADVRRIMVGPAAKCRGAGDQHIRAGSDGLRRGLGVDAAVDLNQNVEVLLGDAVGDRLDLLELAHDELLSAKARIDAHDENQVDVFQYVIE